MDWVYSEEQEALRATVRRFLDERAPSAEVRRLMESELGYDPQVWRQMAEQLGLQGLAIPEEYGGAGFGWTEVGIVVAEMGRSLLPSPYFATVALAANVLLACGDEAAKKDLLPGIASGETIAALALTEEGGSWDPADVRMVARREGDCYLLDGMKTFVLDGQAATLILVVARTDAGLSLFAVDSDMLGLSRTPLPTLDPTRRQARMVFAGLPARLIGTEGGAEAGLVKALHRAASLLAAEQIGGAEWCLSSSVEYAKQRVQFGRPVGSFQAIKHKLADMFIDLELAKSASQYAVWQAAADADELPVAASIAKAYASEAFWQAAVESIQTHGGIGFTWEHDLHLYFKRAKTSQIMLGHPRYHRERIAALVGLS